MNRESGSAAEIEVRGLEKRFGETQALNDLSFSVSKGTLYGLIGPDGAGKTTTLRILCGLLQPDSGECRVAGYDAVRETRQVRRLLGYMPQRFSLYPDLTVAENLRFFADLFGVPRQERLEQTEKLLQFSRLSPFVKRKAAALSGGMKQKLALACTLIHRPQVLLLDEPTTGVDPVSRREFWDILHTLRDEGVTLLITTPYMDEAARCDRIGIVHNGRLLVEEAPNEIPKMALRHLYEVIAEPAFAAAQALSRFGSFFSVQMFGDRLHIADDAPFMEVEERVRNTLAKSNLQLRAIREIPPSIEDVFVERLK
ncbi:MAG: ABC transporter ATP-binding protein [candidate division KSB1 bacterium]|nr:ABC transporter ATP-binding protein [candidate division KSB1 bacterium]